MKLRNGENLPSGTISQVYNRREAVVSKLPVNRLTLFDASEMERHRQYDCHQNIFGSYHQVELDEKEIAACIGRFYYLPIGTASFVIPNANTKCIHFASSKSSSLISYARADSGA